MCQLTNSFTIHTELETSPIVFEALHTVKTPISLFPESRDMLMRLFAFGLFGLHEICKASPLMPCQGPSGCHPFPSVYQLLGDDGKLPEDALNTILPAANSHVVHHQKMLNNAIIVPVMSQCLFLRIPLITGFYLDIEILIASLSVTIQPIPYPLDGLSVKSLSFQFRNRILSGIVICFAQFQVDDVSSSSLIQQYLIPIREGHKLCQT